MRCYVYRSPRKADAYVYLGARDDFDVLPEPLRQAMQPFSFVLELELSADRKLARADASEVLAHLAARGFHLQLPPAR
ncbi:MAG: YcgL domain-containing protein [Xanthomonadales bacterium]|nr:YcgL domain-containing protein [Xanthomonadales bacterium]